MEIRLSSTDGVPVYRQIVNQVKYMVASGRLQAGQELPAIRALAERLVTNPNTVVRAYSELQREGVVESRHGSGTFITERAGPSSASEAARALEPKIDSLLADAAHLSLTFDEIMKLLRERYNRLKKGSAP